MGCDIVLEVEVGAEARKVFDAITTAEGERAFWTADCDVLPKARSVARFGFREAPVPVRMRVDELDSPKRVRWTCLGDFPGWKDTTVTWTLGPGTDDKGTKVEFRHAGWSTAYAGSINYTWAMVLARLKGYCETGKPQPLFA